MLAPRHIYIYYIQIMEISPQSTYTQSGRHAVIEKALQASSQALDIPELTARLGHYAADLKHVLLHAVAPPITPDGEVALEGYRRNSTPVIALHIGEFALRRPNDLLFNTIQRRHIRRTFVPSTARAILEAQTTHYQNMSTPDDTPTFVSDEILAYVYGHIVEASNPSWRIYMRSQPIVALNLDAENPSSPVSTLHELVHVIQMNRRPVSQESFTSATVTIQRELEAYHISAQVILGYRDAGLQEELAQYASEDDQAAMLDIDEIRASHQPSSALSFRITEGLVQDLIDNNLQIIDGDLEESFAMERQQA